MTPEQFELIRAALAQGFSWSEALRQGGYRMLSDATNEIVKKRFVEMSAQQAARAGSGVAAEKAANAARALLDEAARKGALNDAKVRAAHLARAAAQRVKDFFKPGQFMGNAGRLAGRSFLGLSMPAWGALAAAIALLGIGGYIYSRGDAAIEPTALGTPDGRGRNVDDPPDTLAASNEPYGVFMGGPYNEILVGQKSVLDALPTSTLIGWGQDSSKTVKDVATLLRIAGPFDTAHEARVAFEQAMVPNSTRIKPFASGTCARFTFDGKEHDIDNALRFLH